MAYRHQSPLLRQLKVNDPKDIHKDMCLYTYVIEIPGVKEEDVKIRVSEGRFLIIEAQGCKETVSPLEAELERLMKRSREMMEETDRKHRKTLEEMERRVQEQGRKCEERLKHLRKMGEKQKMKPQKELEELNRMSQQQATLFGNMAGYPFLHPVSYHVASGFQQAYGINNTYHQSPAAVYEAGMNSTLPQFNYGVPFSSFPPAAAIPSGPGGFAGSANLPGMFSLNPSATPASSTTGYDDVINSGVWIHGSTSSSTESAIPANTYYSFGGQGQVQDRQEQQHYGNLGYPNLYSSQIGISQEHQQQQTHIDGSLGSTI